MIDDNDQSKLLVVHRSERSSFWLGFVYGILIGIIIGLAIAKQ